MAKIVTLCKPFLLILSLVFARVACALDYTEEMFNKTTPKGMLTITEPVQQLHRTLIIADLHADPLLWARDLRFRSETGHLDIPRLLEGNVGLQVFSAVTQVPFRMKMQNNPSDSDQLPALMMAQAWPAGTWFNVHKRALHQAEKLHALQQSSPEQFRIIKSRSDLQTYLTDRQRNPKQTAGLLALEGVQPLEGSLAKFRLLRDAGYRMMGLAHFFDNEAAGSAHGEKRGGLTEFGRQLVDAMQENGVIVDLAHASAQTIEDVMARVKKPVVVSHTGVDGVCPSVRNLSDAQLRSITATGGVIGIGFWPEAICDISPAGIAKAIRYTVGIVGIEHVALGSDFSGAVTTAIHAGQLQQVTQALVNAGFTEEEIRLIMGENTVRVLMATLPE